MATERVNPNQPKRPRRPPATTPEGRQNQMVDLAYSEAERMMRAGNAPAQIISQFLKLGTTREKAEQDKLAQENALLRAKIENLASAARIEEKYDAAIAAMRSYSGADDDDDEYIPE